MLHLCLIDLCFGCFTLEKKTRYRPLDDSHYVLQGVALLGGKSSGKTTLICSLLAALNGKCAFSKFPGAQKKRNLSILSCWGPGQDIIKYVYPVCLLHVIVTTAGK